MALKAAAASPSALVATSLRLTESFFRPVPSCSERDIGELAGVFQRRERLDRDADLLRHLAQAVGGVDGLFGHEGEAAEAGGASEGASCRPRPAALVVSACRPCCAEAMAARVSSLAVMMIWVLLSAILFAQLPPIIRKCCRARLPFPCPASSAGASCHGMKSVCLNGAVFLPRFTLASVAATMPKPVSSSSPRAICNTGPPQAVFLGW